MRHRSIDQREFFIRLNDIDQPRHSELEAEKETRNSRSAPDRLLVILGELIANAQTAPSIARAFMTAFKA